MLKFIAVKNRYALSLIVTVPLLSFAETAYITERLEIPVRSGESRDHRIIRYLQAGSQIEVLKTYESGYSHIKDERGLEGFVLGRYLVSETPSFVIADRLEAQVTEQKETIKATDVALYASNIADAMHERETLLESMYNLLGETCSSLK